MATLITETISKIRISKQELFDDLKASNPGEFGTKVFDDVEYIKEEDTDESFITIQFKVA